MSNAVILAGGAGSRLKSVSKDVPKCLVEIADKPILEWQLENFKGSEIDEVLIITNEKFRSYFSYLEDEAIARKYNLKKIEVYYEQVALGTGGALALLKDRDYEDFFLVFGDIMFSLDINRFYHFHKSKGANLTALAHPNDHPYDSDLLLVDDNDRVTSILSKKLPKPIPYPNLTNAGLYFVSSKFLRHIESGIKLDFEKDIVANHLDDNVYAYSTSEYVKDCGTPDRFEAVTNDIKSGIIYAKNLLNKQSCIFLDRDGTINVFGDFVTSMDKLKVFDDAPEAIKMINTSKYLAVVITNQPVIARGETSIEELNRIHMKLEDELGEKGAYLNGLYYCPHHPDKGFVGERPEYKINCDCRKPKIGLLLKAQERFNIDFSKSWFIGDTLQDVQTGINAGCRTILLTCGDQRVNLRYKDAKPDYVCNSLLEAVKLILNIDK